jgi:antitoxin ParD1/3/4
LTFLTVDSVSGKMNVSLTDKLEDFVNELVVQGRYRSASEVVREELRLLEIREAQLNPKPKDTENSKEK